MLRKESREIIDNLIDNMNDEERVYTYTQALRKRSAENCAIVESLGPKAVEAFLVGYEQANNQIRKESAGVLGQKAAKFIKGQGRALSGIGGGIASLGQIGMGKHKLLGEYGKGQLAKMYTRGLGQNIRMAAPSLGVAAAGGAGAAYGTARLASILSAGSAE